MAVVNTNIRRFRRATSSGQERGPKVRQWSSFHGKKINSAADTLQG